MKITSKIKSVNPINPWFARRTTCDRCGLRRMCAYQSISVIVTITATGVSGSTHDNVGIGELCIECREAIRREVNHERR